MEFLKSHTKLCKTALFGVLGLTMAFSLVPTEAYAQTSAIEGIIWNLVTNFFGWLVWLGGAMLNHGINEYVIGFGETYKNTGLGFTIDSLWVIVRDIFNLTFIFGLVFIGLRMIFNSGDSSTKKMLVSLVMAALLVNFSLFITKFVIDFSNIAATQLVTAFPQSDNKANVSGAFMQTMGLSGVLNWSSNAGFKFEGSSSGANWGYIFGTMVLFLIAAFVFLGGGILIMIRFVVLNIYMVLSPLMFIGWIFPGAAGITSTYWKGFLGQAFFAPAYLLMLYFAIRILTTFSVTGGSSQSISTVFASNGPATFANTFPPFVLTAIFLIAALVIAKKMGAVGAGGVVSFGQSMTNKVQGYAKGVTSGAASGAWKGATYAPKATARILTNKTGSALNNSFNKWQANAQTAAQAKGSGRLAKTTAAVLSSNVVDRKARGAASALTNAQLGTGTTNNAEAEYKSKAMSRISDNQKLFNGTDPQNLKDLAALRSMVGPLTKSDKDKLDTLEGYERDLKSLATQLSTSRLEELTSNQLKAVAPHLTASQVENVMKSDKISTSDKGAIDQARKDAIEKVVGKTGSILAAELHKLTLDQIETMGDSWVDDNAHLLSGTQVDELKKSKKYSQSQINSFIGTRSTRHKAIAKATGPITVKAGSAPISIDDMFEQSGTAFKPAVIASLGKDILMAPGAQKYLTPDVLEIIGDKKLLSNSERVTLANTIKGITTPTPQEKKQQDYLSSPHGIKNWT